MIHVAFTRPSSMVDQIYQALGRAIASGELASGAFLREAELQKSFGVSKGPLREAIRMLEADGLVVVDAYKKKYVRHITRAYLEDLIPVLACLEGFAGGLAAERLARDEIGRLKRINKEMENSYSQARYDQCSDLDTQFHQIFIKAAKNQQLNDAIKFIRKRMAWFWLTRFPYRAHETIPLSISAHEAIIKEFVNRNPNGAEEIVRMHFLTSLKRSLSCFQFDENGIASLSEAPLPKGEPSEVFSDD